VPVLSRSVSCVTLNASLSTRPTRTCPSDRGALGLRQVDDLDVVAAVDPAPGVQSA
jgi:hypothetical protein